ncbi:unnamed protein product [Adineta steineri]|uniref:histidine--tRNA ligase n=1 Tax=Adineta steineri TaxID=433720 RepID=A0A815AP82_9BILA|nr:unnamed protein product [Adineta steineri]CAF3883582.1 unnamed protein product [Adineta steineri]
MRLFFNTCLYYRRAFYHVRPRQINDTVTKLLNSKNDPLIKNKDNIRNNDKILKLPRGTRDYHPNQMKIREDVFRTIINCFQQHGANTIDTPIMELTTLLKEKYGEDAKLIYELKEQDDDESLALRYDLTVPLARYISQNKISAMKRYHIGKVYRRDSPKMTRGRYREFYQCDFDIVGAYDAMVPDAECVKIIAEILDKLALGQYKININHRKLLDAIFTVCGVPDKLFRSLSSIIDKLDKIPWDIVRNEMINEKGLSPETADRIWGYVQMHGNADLINQLRNDSQLTSQKLAIEALNDLELLFRYLALFNVTDKIVFNLKLARGLDYYTGVIFEAVLTQYQYNPQLDDDQIAVGSIAGGGRYDELVQKLDPKQRYVPCIGLSIGVERIFAIKEHQLTELKIQSKIISTEIYVASAEKNFLEERMKLCTYLWENGFKTEMAYKRNPKLLDQLQYCEKNQIELCIIIGSSELQDGTIKIRNVMTREESIIPREQLAEQLRNHLFKVRQRLTENKQQ